MYNTVINIQNPDSSSDTQLRYTKSLFGSPQRAHAHTHTQTPDLDIFVISNSGGTGSAAGLKNNYIYGQSTCICADTGQK